MKSGIVFYALLSLFLSLTVTSVSAADYVYWQSNGGGCVPTDLTIRNQQYWTVTGGGRVKYRGTGTAPLVFSCPVSSFNPGVYDGYGTVLKLFYQDPDGAGNAFVVSARLLSFNKTTGGLKQVCKVTSDKSGPWRESRVPCVGIDQDKNLYWVEVVVDRAVFSNLVVEFNGVSLEGIVF